MSCFSYWFSAISPDDAGDATSSFRDIPWPMPEFGFLIGYFEVFLRILVGPYIAQNFMDQLEFSWI
jgi:hypothetical protein